MKLMTYNILNGGENGPSLIEEVVKKEAPDFLTLNEANTFAKNKHKLLKKFAKNTGFQHFEIALSGEYDYHVATLSRYPFEKLEKITPLMRAGIAAVIKTDFGELSVISTHLTPYYEDLRLPEVDLIIKKQRKYRNRVLMGDLNSLAYQDEYYSEMIKDFNEIQVKKFTTNGKFRFDVIKKILAAGYTDSAFELKKNKEHTAPTTLNENAVHTDMRLDYIFISKSLTPKLKSYSVVKNAMTDKVSDHYPVVVELG